MADDTNSRLSPTIVAALIALIGVLGAAALNNWDKLFPPGSSPSAKRTAETPAAPPATSGASQASTPAATGTPGAAAALAPRPAPVTSQADAQSWSFNRWHDLTTQFQRRRDLVPNLVAAVTSTASASPMIKKALADLLQARVAVSDPALVPDAKHLSDSARVIAYADAQARLGSAIARMNALTSAVDNPNVQALRSQIEGTENRIQLAIRDYNGSTTAFNATTSGAHLIPYPTS